MRNNWTNERTAAGILIENDVAEHSNAKENVDKAQPPITHVHAPIH
jgi:hypothetical protein